MLRNYRNCSKWFGRVFSPQLALYESDTGSETIRADINFSAALSIKKLLFNLKKSRYLFVSRFFSLCIFSLRNIRKIQKVPTCYFYSPTILYSPIYKQFENKRPSQLELNTVGIGFGNKNVVNLKRYFRGGIHSTVVLVFLRTYEKKDVLVF